MTIFLSGLIIFSIFFVLKYRDKATYESGINLILVLFRYIFYFIFILALILSAFFLFSVLVGWFVGFALPNTAIFRWWPWLNFLASLEPNLGYFILFLAMTGSILSWLAVSGGNHSSQFFLLTENKLSEGYKKFGALFLVGLFLYSLGATWSGIPRWQDLTGNAIAGLLPFNDANGHFIHGYMQAIQGEWHPFIARRPLAAAFRAVLVAVTGFNNIYFLILQSVALALASYFAVLSIVAWRGIWAGLTFLGLTYILSRPYMSTNLTEPLGIFWSLVSVTFLVRALKSSSFSDGLVGLHTTIWALMIRMGSMFTIPALGLWLIFSQKSRGRKIRIAIISVIFIILVNAFLIIGLSKLYSSDAGATGSNFSTVICGLTHGTDWTGCSNIYIDNFGAFKNESEQARFLYAKSIEKFLNSPSILINRLWQGEILFLSGIYKKILSGPTDSLPINFPINIWWSMSLFGMCWMLLRHRERNELLFWVLLLTSIFLSAPFVIFDDGWRVLSTSFPLMFLAISSGFISPALKLGGVFNKTSIMSLSGKYFYLSICIIFTLFFVLSLVTPGAIHKLDLLGVKKLSLIKINANQEVYLGTSHMAGFLIVPDIDPLPIKVPSIHVRDFIKIVGSTSELGKLVTTPQKFNLPFAIVSALPVNGTSYNLLILPENIFTSLNNQPWLFDVIPGETFWSNVIKAKKIDD